MRENSSALQQQIAPRIPFRRWSFEADGIPSVTLDISLSYRDLSVASSVIRATNFPLLAGDP